MGENSKTSEGSICRDYMRNLCNRGDVCKYKHPEHKYIFCHDYQKGKCNRVECVFIHCSHEDELHYNEFGELPPHLTVLPQVRLSTTCKDFMRGECRRANCKFRHPKEYEEHERFRPIQFDRYDRLDRFPERNIGPSLLKRPRFEEFPSRHSYGFDRPPSPWQLLEENDLLRKTISDLKKQVSDLQATNEFLLEQNATMRMKEKVRTELVTVPTVTLANAAQIQTPEVNGTALRAVTAGVNVATVPVSLGAVGTPVSLATVSMAPVQIPASSVAMSHDTATPTQALVSYPIVRSITTLPPPQLPPH